ncbi:MAG: hypothetical protein KDA84_07520, partial [Planctomycetaceae bacterium]|nr:hypothetical protein [Planctomycetaceae bacterium]
QMQTGMFDLESREGPSKLLIAFCGFREMKGGATVRFCSSRNGTRWVERAVSIPTPIRTGLGDAWSVVTISEELQE